MGYFYPVNKEDFEDRFAGSYIIQSTSNFLSGACENDGGSISIFAPGPGFVTVQAEVNMLHDFITGSTSYVYVYLDTSPTGCTALDFSGGYYAGASQLGNQAQEGYYYDHVTVSRKFDVTTAGIKTYYVNARGGLTSRLTWLGKSATFHPQP